MIFIKNCMIVFLFGLLLVGMMFLGVTIIEAKGKKTGLEAGLLLEKTMLTTDQELRLG